MKLKNFIFVALLIPAVFSCMHKQEEKKKPLLVFNGNLLNSTLHIEFRTRDSITFIQSVGNAEIYKTYPISTVQQMQLDSFVTYLSNTKFLETPFYLDPGCFPRISTTEPFWGYGVEINKGHEHYEIVGGSEDSHRLLKNFGWWINALDLELNKERYRAINVYNLYLTY